MQRDFEVFVFPMIEVQSLYKCFKQLRSLNFETFVKDILNIELDKSFQMFSFARRPLPESMKNYAANDAIFTLKCWNALKVIMGDILVQQSSTLLHASKEAVTRKYSFPKVKLYDAGIFSNLFDKFNSNLKLANSFTNIFMSKKGLYENLWNCRIQLGKCVDRRTNSLISNRDLFSIFLKLPLNVPYLEKVVPSSKFWELSVKESIIKCVDAFVSKKSVENLCEECWEDKLVDAIENPKSTYKIVTIDDTISVISKNTSRVPERSHETPGSSKSTDTRVPNRSPDLITINDEHVEPMDIRIEIPNKTHRNYIKDKERKQKSQLKNLELRNKGLPIIVSKRSKGRKWKEKCKIRKLSGLRVGITTLKSPEGELSRADCIRDKQ
jgi:ribonuclease D